MTMILHIGNKNYSSWSLRPWLVLRWAGLPFEEHLIPLGGEGYGQARIPAIRAASPSGRVPALQIGATTVWDSLAISEWAAEQRPGLWPEDATTRAVCRSAVAEMHSGFTALRRDLSMNIRRRVTLPAIAADTAADLDRLFDLWGALRARHHEDGPWLFGRRTIADAFYAPVATRLRTYRVSAPADAEAWCATLLADADFRAWEADAIAEPMFIEQTEALYRTAVRP